VHRDYKGRLEVLAINMKEPKTTVSAWVKKNNTTFRVLLDSDEAVTRAFRVTATPTVYIVDRDGRFVGAAIGTRPWTSPKGRALLEALLRP
jgi:peroxiredoxin